MKVLCVTLNPCIDRIEWYRQSGGEPTRICHYIGGKGVNVARMLQGAGIDSCSLSISGGNADFVKRLCDREAFRSVLVPTQEPVRTMTMVVNHRERGIYQVCNSVNRITQSELEQLMDAYHGLLEEYPSWVIFSGGVAEGAEEALPRMVSAAKAKGCKVFLDSYGLPFQNALSSHPDYIKPNLDELRQTVGELPKGGEIEAVGRLMQYGARNAFLTLGEAGSYLITPERTLWHPGFAVHTVSPIGSGDSFTAFFVYGMVMGCSLEESIAMANAAGAVNAMHVKSGQVTLKSVRQLLAKRLPERTGTDDA